jgi:hypothetical protein
MDALRRLGRRSCVFLPLLPVEVGVEAAVRGEHEYDDEDEELAGALDDWPYAVEAEAGVAGAGMVMDDDMAAGRCRTRKTSCRRWRRRSRRYKASYCRGEGYRQDKMPLDAEGQKVAEDGDEGGKKEVGFIKVIR